jgi:hypothetical protein
LGLIGRTKAALVFGEGAQAQCVLTTVVARALGGTRSGGLHISGPVTFDAHLAWHIREVILPLAASVAESLGLPKRGLDLSVVNLGAASALDLPAHIHGFSADVPLFLALLSARLGLPVPPEVVSTGHIASAGGDISAVRNLPAKLLAATNDKSIRCFIGPAVEEDLSLRDLCPQEAADAQGAVANARRKLKVVTVRDVGELVSSVFPDEIVILAALKGGFFWPPSAPGPSPGPVEKVVQFLCEGNERRFWRVLERYLLAGESVPATELLSAYAQAHIHRQRYPAGFGRDLAQLLRSLPPATRRLKIRFPLLETAIGIQLGQFAAKDDADDVPLLLDATAGRIGSEPAACAGARHPVGERAGSEEGQATLDTLLSELDSASLARTIGLPIDTARATYVLDRATVASHEEFLDTVSAFYLHVCRYVNGGPVPPEVVKDEALALLQAAFADRGGVEAALAEARTPVHGGMRYILDALADRLKLERQIKHVNRVFKEALDPLDSEARIGLMAAFLKRVGPSLPPEMATMPPERLAKQYEAIVRTYVASLDKVKELVRSL